MNQLATTETRASIASLVKNVTGKVTGLDLAIDVLEVVMAFRRDQVHRNLALFFEKIAKGEDVWSDGRFHEKLTKECELTDFSDLVEAVAREQEEPKVDIYANLYCAFVDNEVSDPVLRRHMILAAREMTRGEAELVERVFNSTIASRPNNLSSPYNRPLK